MLQSYRFRNKAENFAFFGSGRLSKNCGQKKAFQNLSSLFTPGFLIFKNFQFSQLHYLI